MKNIFFNPMIIDLYSYSIHYSVNNLQITPHLLICLTQIYSAYIRNYGIIDWRENYLWIPREISF